MNRHQEVFLLFVALFIFVCSEDTAYENDTELSNDVSSGRRVDIICNLGEELCLAQCFDPVTQHCQPGPYGVKLACKLTETLCGWYCLPNNETSLTCVDDQVCLAGQAVCSAKCYSPDTHHCLENRVCPIHELLCGGYGCYNPEDKTKTCHRFESTTYLCNSNENVCENSGCYDPEVQKCDEQRLCDIDETFCGYQCANPANGDICMDNTRVCKAGEALCGFICYNATSGEEICREGIHLCKADEELCGTQDCYNPAKGQTCHNEGGYHVVCESGLDYCYYNCYDKEKEDCLPAHVGANYSLVCPKQPAPCDGDLSRYVQRYICYDPSDCMPVDPICDEGQELCGRTCYDAADIASNVCFDKVGVICKPDEDICGSVCYNKATKKCFANVFSPIIFPVG